MMEERRRLRSWIVAISVGLVAISLAATGCGGGNGDSGSGDSDKTFGFSMPFLTNEFFVALNDVTTATMESEGWEVLESTDANQQVDKQVTDVNNLIGQGATGLAIDPFDSAGIVPALNAAEEADVPVVLVDVGASGGSAYMTVFANNKLAGRQVCEEMGKRLADAGKSDGTVLELQGELASVAGRDRTDGFEDCMESDFPDVEVIGKPTQWQGPKAADATQTVLASESIDAIYMQSDCGMLAPVQSVMKQAGKAAKVGQPGHIILGGIDGCPPSLKAIKDGTLDFTVEQPIVAYGQRVAYFLDQALAGKEQEVGPDGFGGKIVEGPAGLENIIPATLVTEENVDAPDLWANQPK